MHSKQIITLLLFEKEYTSIGTISERLFLSRSSVTSDLPQVKRIISRTPGADLLVSGQYGLKIQASENVKRIMCMKTMQSRQDYHMLFSEEEMEEARPFVGIIQDDDGDDVGVLAGECLRLGVGDISQLFYNVRNLCLCFVAELVSFVVEVIRDAGC